MQPVHEIDELSLTVGELKARISVVEVTYDKRLNALEDIAEDYCKHRDKNIGRLEVLSLLKIIIVMLMGVITTYIGYLGLFHGRPL